MSLTPSSTIIDYWPLASASIAMQLDWKTLTFIPAALLGAWLGLCIFKRLSDRQFELAVNLLLIASGVGLFL
jgi:uncharacterized membrane protein YfcA